jgi:uncharacterized protein (TIGR02266 family)
MASKKNGGKDDDDKGGAKDAGAKDAAKASKGKKAPSVASFLSKISTPKGQAGAASPAKGLLGGITRDDLAAVGRGDGDMMAPPHTGPSASGVVPVSDDGISIEIGLGDNGGRKLDRVMARHTVGVRGVFSGEVLGEDGAPLTKDISAGGVFIETAHLLEVGDPVVLSFPLDDGKTLVVNGRVRWVTPFGNVDDPTPGMGVEFVGVDAQKRDRIQAILARPAR